MPLSAADRDMMIRTVIGEADDQSPAGQAAVAHVILNRLRSGEWGDTATGVVLARNQFEPWQTRARELNGISANSRRYQSVGQVVDSVLSGETPDPTGGATHFLDPAIVRRRRGGTLPDWAQGNGVSIGDHTFYAPGNANYGRGGVAAINAAIGAGQGGGQALGFTAQPVTQSDIDETARSLGLGGGPAAAPASSIKPQAVEQDDLDETARALGLTPGVGTTPKPVPAAPADLNAPTPGQVIQAPPDIRTAASAVAPKLGTSAAMVEGMPIVGPLTGAASAALGATLQPVLDPNAPASWGERFERNRAVEQEALRQWEEAHPGRAVAGNLLGGGMITGPMGATNVGGRLLGTVGSTLGARVYGGVLGGAGIGGVDAALRGENPLTGAELGAAFGGAGVGAGEATGGLITAARNALARPSGPLGGLNPIARGWLADALANETPASLAAASDRMGPHGFVADINPQMTELAAGVANRAEPPGSALVGEAYRNRQAQQRQITEDAITSAFGPRQNLADVTRAERQARSAAADPLYDQWRQTHVTPTPELKELGTMLEEEGFFKDANRLLRADNRPTYENFFTPGARKEWPTAEAWDYVKQAIDGRIKANMPTATSAGNPNEVRVYTNLKNRLIDAIDNHPDDRVAGVWQEARQAWANPTAIMSAREAGQDVFRRNVRGDELGYTLTDYSPPERAAFREGARDALAQLMDASRRGDANARNMLLAPANQEKLLWISPNGPRNADRLIQTLQQQEYLGEQAKYVNPRAGSPTAPRSAASRALEPPSVGEWNPSLTSPLSWLPPSWIEALRPSTVLQGGRNASYAGARQQIAPVLVSGGRNTQALLTAINAEGARRLEALRAGNAARALTTGVITGPVSETARLQGGFQPPALAPPAH